MEIAIDKEYELLKKQYYELQDRNTIIATDLLNLRAEFAQYKKESIKWGIEDFLTMNEDESEYEITAERAREALEHMINRHDAEMGITWTTVEYYYGEYRTEKEEIGNDGIFK